MERGLEGPTRLSTGVMTVGGLLRRLLVPEMSGLLVASAIFLGIAVFISQSSPSLRWLLLILFLGLVGLIAGRLVLLQTVPVESLGGPQPRSGLQKGDLVRLSATLRRGGHGMRYSQLGSAVNVRDAFLDKIRAESGIPEDDESLEYDMHRLAVLCQDEELFRFLERVHLLESSMADFLRSSEAIILGGPSDFTSKMNRVISKMEAWP